MTSKNLTIRLKRGIYWPGMTLECFADDAETVPADLTGWTPQALQAFSGVGVSSSFSLPVTAGGESHQATLSPIEGSTIQTWTAGEFKADLVFHNEDGKPVGPFARFTIIVEEVFFVA